MTLSLIERPGKKIEAKDFRNPVVSEDFNNCRIEWCRGKGVEFQDCNFSSSLIRSCYFHKAVFKNCNFIGATFVDSNFRSAKFIGCDFSYAVFRGSQIEASEIVANLPHWENAQRDLLRSARKNAEAMGDVEDVRLLLRAEMIASEEHWRSASRAVTGYYRDHYPGCRGRVTGLIRLWAVRLGRWFWGHGESPGRLCFSFFLWVLAWSSYLCVTNDDSSMYGAVSAVLAVILLGDGASSGVIISDSVVLILAASRFLFFGLFVALIVRRFARR
jgi:hypothetical protein